MMNSYCCEKTELYAVFHLKIKKVKLLEATRGKNGNYSILGQKSRLYGLCIQTAVMNSNLDKSVDFRVGKMF